MATLYIRKRRAHNITAENAFLRFKALGGAGGGGNDTFLRTPYRNNAAAQN